MDKTMKPTKDRRAQHGWGMLELLIVVAIVAIVGTFALISIRKSTASLALQNSVRLLAGNIERARLDAVRRHGTSTVQLTSPSAYSVFMDFDGSGTPVTRNFLLDTGVALPQPSPLPPPINFNWRGRTLACTNTFAFFNSNGEQSWVDVSDAGDVTVNGDVSVLPTITYATMSSTSDIAPGTVVSGSTVHNNTVDCSDSTSGSGGPPISGGGTGGCPTWTASPSSLSIKKNGGTTGTIALSVGGSSAIVSATAPINLLVTPATQTIGSGSSSNFSITSLNSTRGTFAVTFTLPCASPQVIVKVTN